MLIIAAAALAAQQVGKFENRQPSFVISTKKRMEDVERCMIRFGSPPLVYRQPDKPDDVTLVWVAGSLSAGNAAARVDLKRIGTTTRVTSWLPAKEVRACVED